MNFGQALEALKAGGTVTREGWKNVDIWLMIINGCNDWASLHGYGFGEYMGEPTFTDVITMRTADNKLTSWAACHQDLLAEDWSILP